MKKVLITGARSYIGTSVERWMRQPQFAGKYKIDTVDMRESGWKDKDFSSYDTVFHVAGIAHTDIGKVTEEQKKQYYAINCNLALETAKKAKREGVSQFIYMSSIIVYGEGSSVRKKRVITRETQPRPSNFYGGSKWKAEQRLNILSDSIFHLAVLRPPMIYGNGCRGNYQMLKRIALTSPVFPNFHNERSVCSIENFSEIVRNIIDSGQGGLYFPQDPEYISTAQMVRSIAEQNGKKVVLVRGVGGIILLLGLLPGKIGRMVNKGFGNLVYEKGIGMGE